MSNNNFNTIKLDCDLKKPALAAIDLTTKNPVEFWLFNNLKFCITLLNNGALFAFDNVTKVILGVKPCDSSGYPLDTQNFDILKEVAVANISTTLSEDEYAAGSSHFEAEILPADISTQMQSGVKWVVVQIVNTDGSKLTFFAGNAICKNDAADGFATGENLSQIKGYLETAQTAATNAETSASNAAQSATTAEQEATAASVARDDAYLAQIGAENAKTTAIEANTQAQAAKQAAIDAANTATQAVGVQDLKQSKNERGTYYINGGTITSAAFALSAPFTYFITYKAGFVGNLFSKGNTSLTVAASGTLTLTDGTNTATATIDATKDHLIAVEVLTTSASLIIDGIATTPTTFTFADTASTGVVIGGTTTDGKLARPILFNFGISETNAPYTFADYQSGADLSPYLTNTIGKVEDPNLGASTDGGWDITEDLTTTITKGKWTARSELVNEHYPIRYLKNRTIGSAETAAGIQYAIDLRSSSVIGGEGGLFYNDEALTMYNTGKVIVRAKFKYLKITNITDVSPFLGFSVGQITGRNGAIIHIDNFDVKDHDWHEYNQILTANTNLAWISTANSRIGISAGGLTSDETGPSWSIADFHFEILGALYAPADFVITTGTTRNIPDLSGQGKDATLSGQPATVKTGNDIKVAKLKEYFTANS